MSRKMKNAIQSATPKQASVLVAKAAEQFRAATSGQSSATFDAVVALREARATGYLYTGASSDRPDGTITLAGLADLFEVSRATTTFWGTLATALDVGVNPESDVWTMLFHGKAARRSEVSKAIKADGATIAGIRAALKADGWHLNRDKRNGHDRMVAERVTGQGQGPRSKGDGDKEKEETPLSSFDACKAALQVLRKEYPHLDSEEFDVIGNAMAKVLRDARKHHGRDPRTGKVADEAAA